MNVIIRAAKQNDATAISSIILHTASNQLRNEFSDDGWELFLKLLNSDTQQSLITNKKFNYYVAVVEHTVEDVIDDIVEDSKDSVEQPSVVGMMAIKDGNHLFHLFISQQWQGKGIGKKLWQNYLDTLLTRTADTQSKSAKFKLFPEKSFDKITVNSSDYALKFYQRLGFVMEAGRQKKNGICYTPMVYSLE